MSEFNTDLIEGIYYESFGVRIGIEAENGIALNEFFVDFRRGLSDNYKEIDRNEVEHLFQLRKSETGNRFELLKDGKNYHSSQTTELIFGHLDTQMRVTIAENAVGKVFLHAGAVGWKGKAIIIPGKSFFGKTTLVAALAKKGALYYSDEYAVLDEKGFVHPFPKMLSLRGIIDNFRQLDVSIEKLGGKSGNKEIPVGMILFTEYESESIWEPTDLSMGEGIMALIPHTIPIRKDPEFSLNVLNKIVNRAIISKTQRGEAEVFAEIILNFFETRAL